MENGVQNPESRIGSDENAIAMEHIHIQGTGGQGTGEGKKKKKGNTCY